jgi:hypothetical protein
MTAAQNITQLFTGYKWPTTTISYTFITEYAPYTLEGDQEPAGPTLLSEEQKAATRQLFADIQSFLGIQFAEVTQDNSQNQIGQIAIGMRNNLLMPAWVGQTEANLNLPGKGGDIWLKAGSYGNGAATNPGDLGLVFEEKISPYQVDGVRSWFDQAEPAWEAGHRTLLNNGIFGSIQQASDFII